MSFSPADVPEVAAGYYWDPASATGLGGSGFKIPEGNGHTSFDLVQATTTKQPTALAENDNAQFRMRRASDTNPSVLANSGNVQAGWTGPTYVAGWFRLPDVAGDITGAGNLFLHTPSTAGQRRFTWQLISTAPRGVRVSTSTNGTATATSDYPNVLAGSAWTWLEAMFDSGLTLGGSTVADYIKLFADFVPQLRTSSSGTNTTTLFNGNAPLAMASRAASALANVDTTDFGPVYYANGIPTIADRTLLRNYHNPGGATQPNARGTIVSARGSVSVSDPHALFNAGRARGAATED